MLILACFPLFDVGHLEIANCSNFTIVFYLQGNFGQSLCIRSCHEDLILKGKGHNCAGIAIIQGDSAGGSKLIEQTLTYGYIETTDNGDNYTSPSILLTTFKVCFKSFVT